MHAPGIGGTSTSAWLEQPSHGNLGAGAGAARGIWSSVLCHGAGICEALQIRLPFPE